MRQPPLRQAREANLGRATRKVRPLPGGMPGGFWLSHCQPLLDHHRYLLKCALFFSRSAGSTPIRIADVSSLTFTRAELHSLALEGPAELGKCGGTR